MFETLGRYKILDRIGAGGMGEVYRARDTRLGRTVAIKVLPDRLAADPERRDRLIREARAAAALSHPNIVTIYDVGNAEGYPYIAMELLEGISLDAALLKNTDGNCVRQFGIFGLGGCPVTL